MVAGAKSEEKHRHNFQASHVKDLKKIDEVQESSSSSSSSPSSSDEDPFGMEDDLPA